MRGRLATGVSHLSACGTTCGHTSLLSELDIPPFPTPPPTPPHHHSSQHTSTRHTVQSKQHLTADHHRPPHNATNLQNDPYGTTQHIKRAKKSYNSTTLLTPHSISHPTSTTHHPLQHYFTTHPARRDAKYSVSPHMWRSAESSCLKRQPTTRSRLLMVRRSNPAEEGRGRGG